MGQACQGKNAGDPCEIHGGHGTCDKDLSCKMGSGGSGDMIFIQENSAPNVENLLVHFFALIGLIVLVMLAHKLYNHMTKKEVTQTGSEGTAYQATDMTALQA